ncbi:MerR family transcriptional regulator [Coralliovum pocilloporae]|uniref:MerR family transcriptional regulator n=1 Tax=Coralliovum pocilloporae TaxID=3066369 RepID=UPI0033078432
MQRIYTISDLAEEFGVTTRTLRFYEDRKLVSPTRRGSRRLYSQRDRTRLKLILRGKRLGFELSEISEIISMYEAKPGERGQLETLMGRIAQRRDELLRKRRDLDVTLAELDAVETGCRKRLKEMMSDE